jgi:hypothetical protein
MRWVHIRGLTREHPITTASATDRCPQRQTMKSTGRRPRIKGRTAVSTKSATSLRRLVATLCWPCPYQTSDEAVVQRLLARPIFIIPTAEVQARLDDSPLMPAINNVTMRADGVTSDFILPDGWTKVLVLAS